MSTDNNTDNDNKIITRTVFIGNIHIPDFKSHFKFQERTDQHQGNITYNIDDIIIETSSGQKITLTIPELINLVDQVKEQQKTIQTLVDKNNKN